MVLKNNIQGDQRRTELELGIVRRQVKKQTPQIAAAFSDLSAQSGNDLPPINQLIRNGDKAHSVDSWYNAVPVVGDQQKECAEIYAYAPDSAVTVSDGEIDIVANANRLKCLASLPFEASDVGKRIIVAGAGASSGKLVTTISAYVAPGEVDLTLAASTTVTGARVRFRLQKLTRKNAKNSADPVTDALKDDAHTNYSAVGQINDPDWDKEFGWSRLGSLNRLGFWFGYFRDPATNQSDFRTQNPLVQGNVLYFIAKVARASQYVKLRGHIGVGIYNNDDSALSYLQANDMSVTGLAKGTPQVTASTQYQIIAETDRGFTYKSNIFTIADAPSASSYVSGAVFVSLNWSAIQGALRYKIYRKIAAGNVELLYTVTNGSTGYNDDNNPRRVDTNSISFPALSDALQTLQSYIATRSNALDSIGVNGSGNWTDIELAIPVETNTSMSNASEVCVLMGLTSACSTYLTDGVLNATDQLTSAAGQFTSAKHNGKTAIITNPNSGAQETKVLTYVSANEMTLSSASAFTGEGMIVEILEGEPHGLLVDKVGASLTNGVFAHHPEDNARAQNIVSNPDSSSQGGISGGTGGGGIRCNLYGTEIELWTPPGEEPEFIFAEDLKTGHVVWQGSELEGGIVLSVRHHRVKEIFLLETDFSCGFFTRTARFLRDWSDAEIGVPLPQFQAGQNILLNVARQTKIAKVRRIRRFLGNFPVVEIRLQKDTRGAKGIYSANQFWEHNLKSALDEDLSF